MTKMTLGLRFLCHIVTLIFINVSYSSHTLAAGKPTQSGNLTDYGDEHFATQVRKPLSVSSKDWTGPFRWVQLGDSHTAGDTFTGEIRDKLQAKYGNAGFGWVSPGYVNNQRSESVKFSSLGDWSAVASRNSTAHLASSSAGFPFGGMLGQSSTAGSGVNMTIKRSIPTESRIRLSVILPPSSAALAVGLADVQLSPNADTPWQPVSIQLASLGSELSLWSPAGGTKLAGLVIDFEPANNPNSVIAQGVTVDAMGINGAEAKVMNTFDPAATQAFLTWRQPNLVVLAYGTNEAFDPRASLPEIAQNLRNAIKMIRTHSQATVMLLGVPDIAVVSARARKRKVAACGEAPPSASAVRETLRHVAQSEKTLYWDWAGAMQDVVNPNSRVAASQPQTKQVVTKDRNGKRVVKTIALPVKKIVAPLVGCVMAKLANASPALAQPDQVHFTAEGYATMGRSLLKDLEGLVRH